MLCQADLRRIAISIGIVSGTARRHVRSLGRLRELPNISKVNAAVCGARRSFGKDASRRRRTGIIPDPVHDLSCASILADIIGGDDVLTTFLQRRNTGTVNASEEAACADAVDPGIDVGFLLWQHAAALLLIEKDDGLRGKAFAPGRGHSRLRIGFAKLACKRNRL